MSSVRKYQQNVRVLLNTALQMFRSRQIKTVIVEGPCDKRFIGQWMSVGAKMRFDGFDGKSLVESVYRDSRAKPYSDYEFLYFVVDVDFDLTSGRSLYEHPSFIYNAFCFDERRLHFNDLESFLINTRAFEKVLVNLDVDTSMADVLRTKLERASRVIGSIRAADIVVQKSLGLRSSVLNGFEIRAFFEASDITFDEEKLKRALPKWSNYPHHVDDLIAKAGQLDRESSTVWSLSRGHDLTEMLALYLEHHGVRGMTAEKIELMLRLACEFSDFKASPMGRRLDQSGGMALLCGAGDGKSVAQVEYQR